MPKPRATQDFTHGLIWDDWRYNDLIIQRQKSDDKNSELNITMTRTEELHSHEVRNISSTGPRGGLLL